MDLRHQLSAMCNHVRGKKHTPVVSTPGSIPVATENKQQPTHTSHYPSRPTETRVVE